ncbi:MAG: hypothetical protein IJJ26_02405 [Victivallales bacterium]|nr:hypothetical protein [Victivallales bacterium]
MMVLAFSLLLLATLLNTALSISTSVLSHEKFSFFQFYAVGYLLASLLGGLVLVRWGRLPAEGLFMLFGVLLLMSVCNMLNMTMHLLSFKYGHNGLTTVIGNSSSLMTLAFGVFVLGETASILSLTGVVFLLTGLTGITLTQVHDKGNSQYDLRRWALCVIAYWFMSSLVMIASLLTSHVPKPALDTGLRVPILFLETSLFYFIASPIEKRLQRNPKPLFAFTPKQRVAILLWSLLAVVQTAVLFLALDEANRARISAFFWPLTSGLGLFLFTLYSKWKLREKYTIPIALSMLSCAIGIVLIAAGKHI